MMIRRKNIVDVMLFFLLGGLYVYSLTLTIMESTVLDIDRRMIFVTCLALLVLIFFIFYNVYTAAAFSIVAVLFFLILVSGLRALRKPVVTSGFFYDMATFFTDLFLFIRGYLPYEQVYTLPILIFICAVIALFTFLSLYLHFKFYFLALFGFVIFIINWIMEYSQSNTAYVIFLFCVCVFLCKHMNRSSVPSSRKDARTPKQETDFTLSVIPACLVVIAAAYLLPSSDKEGGYSAAYQFFNGPLTAVNEFFYITFNPKYFSFQTTGFTGRHGRLGGKVALNGRGVMEVHADTRVYLSGTVRDIYTGTAWESTGEDTYYDYASEGLGNASDYNETALFLAGINKEVIPQDMRINIGTARTGTIFRPMKNNGLQYTGQSQILMNQQGDLRTEALLPSHTEYNYQYLTIDYSDNAVLDALRLTKKGFYQELLDFMHSFSQSTYPAIEPAIQEDAINLFSVYFLSDLQEYSAYANRIYEQYTSIPDTVPQRVYDLAMEITKGYGNDYDKIKAIEQYLTTFPYTLTPGDVPEGRDFVDYFLFDEQEGYCTYYASAMAILSRCAGLPARYVEGYIMPPERGGNGAFNITNRQAHSWAEVYFEGFGWIPFEATAPFSYPFYRQEVPADTQVFSSGFMEDPYYLEYLEQMGMQNQYRPAAGLIDTATQDIEMTIWDKFIVFLQAVAIVVGCILLYYIGIGFRICQEKLRFRRIKSLSNNRQASEYYLGILKMTKYYRYPINPHETPAQYANRIGKRFAFHNDTIFIRDLTTVFYKAKYSGKEISDKELEMIEAAYFELLDFIRSMRHHQIFLLNRYVLCKL